MLSATWLQSGTDLPADGKTHEVVYRTGNHSSANHLAVIGPFLRDVLGCEPFRGSLNCWADAPVAFDSPHVLRLNGVDWYFAPVIIEESRVGVAARRPPPAECAFIEVFACDRIAPALCLKPEDRFSIRILRGKYLTVAA